MREYIAPMIDSDMLMFSLPYLNFEIEMLAREVDCVERDVKTFRQQLKIAPPHCYCNLGNASDFIGQSVYDFVYLDLCGPISKEMIKCFENVKLTKRGELVVTVLRAREPRQYSHLLKDGREEMYKKLLKEKAGLNLYRTISYYDTSPIMVLFAHRKYHRGKVENLVIED